MLLAQYKSQCSLSHGNTKQVCWIRHVGQLKEGKYITMDTGSPFEFQNGPKRLWKVDSEHCRIPVDDQNFYVVID